MTDSPLPGWKEAQPSASFADPHLYGRRTTRFERAVRRRNLIEYAAGALVLGTFSFGAFVAAMEGDIGIGASFALVIAGTLVLLWNLHHRASNLEREPEASCRDHFRRQLERQRDALLAVPRWYVAPLLPGLVLFYAIVTTNVAAAIGWLVALQGILPLIAVTAAFFALVIWLNRRAALALGRELAEFDARYGVAV